MEKHVREEKGKEKIMEEIKTLYHILEEYDDEEPATEEEVIFIESVKKKIRDELCEKNDQLFIPIK